MTILYRTNLSLWVNNDIYKLVYLYVLICMVDSTHKLRERKQYNWLLKNDVRYHSILFHAIRHHSTVLLAKNKNRY